MAFAFYVKVCNEYKYALNFSYFCIDFLELWQQKKIFS